MAEVLSLKNRSIKKPVGEFEKDLGRVFEDLRRQKQLRMVDVARLAGIAPSAYCQIENGTCSSRIEVVARVAAALRVELVFRLVPEGAPFVGSNSVRPPHVVTFNGEKED